MKIEYPKALMTKSELKRMGIPEAVIERAIHHADASNYAFKTGRGKTCKWQFITKEFGEYLEEGAFKL